MSILIINICLICFSILKAEESSKNILEEEKLKKLSDEKGSFVTNSIMAIKGGYSSKNIKADEVIVKFNCECAEKKFKIGDDIFFYDTKNGDHFAGKLLKFDNKLLQDSGEGYLHAGISSINLKTPEKSDENSYKKFVALFKFKEEDAQFCSIKKDYKDERLKPLIKKYQSKDARSEQLDYMETQLIEAGERSFALVSYTFDKKFSEDHVEHIKESLLFEKTNNEFVFIQKADFFKRVQLCLKQKNKPKWQFLIESDQEYTGSTDWSELTEKGFVDYHQIDNWCD